MKKFSCFILSLTFIFLLFGCNSNTINSSSDTNRVLKQEVTIVKMPSPPKCKTTDDTSVVNEVINVLGQIEKTAKTCGNTNGWSIMIKLNIDGQNLDYTIASDTFTDSDGKQYSIVNFNEIEEKILGIYDKINTPEVNYP